MKLKMVSIYDSKAQAYLPPFFVRHVAHAVRGFQGALTNAETDFGKFPIDYSLHEFGEFDDETGQLELHPEPRGVMTGTVALAQARQDQNQN